MENRKIKKVFRSRISVLFILLWLAMLIPIIPALKYTMAIGLWIIGVILFTVFLYCGIHYVISDDKLYIKIWTIPGGSVNISDIISIERSYYLFFSSISLTAASFKKLRAELGGRAKLPYILISPVKEQEFIKELLAVNPDIYVHVPVKKGIWRIQDWDI